MGEECVVVPTLLDQTMHAVRDGWARQLRVAPSLVAEPGVHVVTRMGATAVVVLRLGPATVAVAPPPAAARLRSLGRDLLLDTDAVVGAIDDPAARPIGTATLAFTDGATLVTPSQAPARPADPDDVAALLAAVETHEGEESGLAGMPERWTVDRADGVPAAVAGYVAWQDRVAQLGVLVHPDHRHRGLAMRAAGTAARAAISAGLVPQWRCRLGNDASARLADGLGFVPLGRQLAVALDHAAASRA